MTDCGEFTDEMPRIILSLNQAGVIILRDSGVIYQNQTRGNTCKQRCAEGVLALISNPILMTGIPMQLYQCPIEAGLKKIDWDRSYSRVGITCADEIDALLQSNGSTKNISVDRTRLKESEEAWVYVKLKPLGSSLYEGSGACDGVLVWSNSD